MAVTISDLHDQPQFFGTVANRIWEAWWRANDYRLSEVETGLMQVQDDRPASFALVAHDGDTYLGSALGIRSDLEDRPNYSPWIAAVWVEPEHRLKQVGRQLVGRAFAVFVARGRQEVYLCSHPCRRDFYIRQGWVPIEQNVGRHRQIVYRKTAAI